MKIIESIARSKGAMLEYRTCHGSYSYDGYSIAIYDDLDGRIFRSYSNILHDIAHYVVCPEKRKRMPEFGLGTSPDNETKVLSRVVNADTAFAEEAMASALGIVWEKEIGYDWYRTYINHNWPAVSKESVFDTKNLFTKTLRKLYKRNYISSI